MEEEPSLKALQTNANQFSQFTENKGRLRKIENPQHLGARRNREKLLGPTHCLLVSESKLFKTSEEVWSFKNLTFYRVVVRPWEREERKPYWEAQRQTKFPFSLPCFSPGKSLKQPSAPSQDEVDDPRANLSISPRASHRDNHSLLDFQLRYVCNIV